MAWAVFKIEAITEMVSVAPSHILSAITHAALTMKIPRLDNKIFDNVKVQIM